MKIGFFALFFSVSAFAYTLPASDQGRDIRWRYGQKLFMAGNPAGGSRVTGEEFRRAAIFALQQWKWATRGILDFDYWQGSDPAHYPTALENDGLNAIFFASHSYSPTDPNVIGYTQLLYNATNGDIIEADILLNDRDFEFTDSPADTTSTGGRRVHLGSVLTHELGHVIGLSHSAEVNASLLHVEFLEQHLLGCDDQVAARQLYSAHLPEEGGLTGKLLTPFGDPLAGARVTAISKDRGISIATAHTDPGGVFQFQGLEPGVVALQVSPYSGPASAIPARFRPASSPLCGGPFMFPFQFLTEEDGHQLTEHLVEPGRVRSIGTRVIHCTPIQGSGNLFQGRYAPDLLVDTGPLLSPRVYTFRARGPFRISGLGYLLHSPVSVDIEIADGEGRPIPMIREAPLYRSSSGSDFQIPDASLTGTAFGDVIVRATPRSLASSAFPLSIDQSDTPFFVLGFTSNPRTSNARCLPSSSFPAYSSPSGNPPRFASTRSARDGVGFCGRAHAGAREGTPSRIGQSLATGDILGWLLPFALIGVFQLNSVLRRIRLKTRWRNPD